ncbi:zinc finger BED domain-containing protein RICESLEEPER 2-like [Apium graveolens]|uniref:zinc finger BED domain-containing protein RICESLEEPER 2-like n=1 Tax=Apium graveolens TaxID=4045 RepID=UPI003D7AEB1E
MVVTGHWIDSNWNLNMRVLNFCNVPPPHTGYVISEALFKCLNEWGIVDKIGTITVDNAKANDVALRNLKQTFSFRKKLLIDGKLFHARCCAHILNLCVKDGLDPIDEIVGKVRDGVKYVAASEGRRIKFAEISLALSIKYKKLILDVSTRWNSTYNMLSCALQFKEVFTMYATSDGGFRDYVPGQEDWERVEEREISLEKNETSQVSSSDTNFMNEQGQTQTPQGMNDYESFIRESGGIVEPTKSELEEYLSEKIIAPTSKFDVLAWWKGNSSKFPILSKMACDVLSIPISTVVLESSFSAGGRVIEPHRSCLKPETVEMLLCGADWVRELYGLKKSKQQKEDKDVVIHLD